MRLLLTLVLLLSFFNSKAQDDSPVDAPHPQILALGSSVQAAQKFNEEVASRAVGYTLAFIDQEKKPMVRYVYKSDKDGTLRLDYKYENVPADSVAPARKVVIFQRINGELPLITGIYNFLFSTNHTPQSIMNQTCMGIPIVFRNRTYTFSFQPDDYEAGYWVMTFVAKGDDE